MTDPRDEIFRVVSVRRSRDGMPHIEAERLSDFAAEELFLRLIRDDADVCGANIVSHSGLVIASYVWRGIGEARALRDNGPRT
jgi:hypothetical protein